MRKSVTEQMNSDPVTVAVVIAETDHCPLAVPYTLINVDTTPIAVCVMIGLRRNLRPLPPKRQLTGEQKDGGINEKLIPQRRKLVFRQPKKRSSQQRLDRRSNLTQNQEAHLLRSIIKSNNNKSIINKKPPVYSCVTSYKAWPLS